MGESSPFTAAIAPGGLPVLGHALQLQRRPLEFLASLPAHGDVVTLRFGPVPVYLVCHPELARRVLQDGRTFDKGGLVFDKAKVFLGNGLATCPRADHRRQRRLVQPAFHPDRITAYTEVVLRETTRMMEGWQPGQAVEIRAQMHRLSAQITARTLLSTDFGGADANELASCMAIVSKGLYRQMLMPVAALQRLPTPANRRFHQALARLRALISRVVADYRRHPGDRGDLLSALLAARDEDSGATLDDQEIHDQVLTLMGAGSETSGNALAWTFHYLGTHPDVETRLHAELDAVLAGRAPHIGDLPQLDVVRRAFTETLRLRPPGWLATRITTTATELAGRPIPAGANVAVSHYALHHDRRWFPHPEHFDPDRWLPERAHRVPRGAMIPFGAGSRKCIGDTLALTSAALVMAAIANRWRLGHQPGPTLRAVPRMTLGLSPLHMLLTPRPGSPSASD
ncbi:cytochrome P450 [Streptomyces sp. C]|uniref:cytochrome P450 n=1 Tax=Streptomyces sp. C TaxID=253839 RepID=UPI0001B5092D|nr:cytochrome P450 [Streptomyces sp. C]EFL20031.1 predicted protein [Streptomyces sp. C]